MDMHYVNMRKDAEKGAVNEFTITLSDMELDSLKRKASNYNIEPTEILEDFVADLVYSYRTGGSDERDRAYDWFWRRGYSFMAAME